MSELLSTNMNAWQPPDPNMSYGKTLVQATTQYNSGHTESGVLTHLPSWVSESSKSQESATEESLVSAVGAAALDGITDPDITLPNTRLYSRETVGSTEGKAGKKEFDLGGVHYKVSGVVALGQRTGFVFESQDRDVEGTERKFFVYQSLSEGSWRVSQGVELYNGKNRYLKGAEDISPLSQYTQDTQLHPDFEREFASIAAEKDGTYSALRFDEIAVDDVHSRRLAGDFLSQQTVFCLGSPELHSALAALPAGQLVKSHEDEEYNKILDQQVGKVNALLATEGLVPDFTKPPIKKDTLNHPLLGLVKRETFTHTMPSGVEYEWTMSYAANDVEEPWIERIRLANSEVNQYGTDTQMLYSGFLTSKPIEYRGQATLIPEDKKKELKGNYVDIRSFLQGLAPVASFVNSKRVRG